jgi:hypothetical protein
MADATPQIPLPAITTPPVMPVKIPTPEFLIFKDDKIPIEVMTDLIFENIGGHELINISRNDILNGQDILYNPIKNISSVYFQYNPNNILALQGVASEYFSQFAIDFGSKIPAVGTGTNDAIVYLDSDKNLIIELVNMKSNESVEVQIQVNGSKFSDTIYEVNE